MHHLIAFKEALIESNKVLAELYANPNYEGKSNIMATILENEKQIDLITKQYHINEN